MVHRLLLAIDETPAGEVGVTYAAGLARLSGASVHVVHANVFLVGGRGTTRETPSEAAAVVERAVDELRDAGIQASGETLLANVFTLASQITDLAAQRGSDMIVLGSHRRGRWTHLLGRGTRECITRATALPVVTAPAPLRIRRRSAAAEVRHMAEIGHW